MKRDGCAGWRWKHKNKAGTFRAPKWWRPGC